MPWRERIKKKWPFIIMYLFFATAGIMAMFYPTQSVLTTLERSLAYLWAGTLAGGGTLAFVGCIRGGLVGETLGIPLCSGGNLIFAIAVLSGGQSAAAVAIGMVFAGIAIGILQRWFEVRGILNTSIKTPRRRRE